MKKTVGVKWGNLKVGLFLVAVIAILFWSSLSGGGTSIFESKKQFVCYFENVQGLLTGSPVWMSGVEVGNVRSAKFVILDSVARIKVVCRVKSSVWDKITTSAQVQLGTIGLLGDKFVDVVPGHTSDPQIEVGAEIPSIEANDAEAMFRAGKDAMARTGDLADNLNELLDRMNRGEGTLGLMATDDSVYHSMTTLLTHLTKLTVELHKNQERIVSSIEGISQSTVLLSDKVTANTGTIGKLVNDPALYDNLSATSAKMDTILQKINSAEGTLGLFVNDTVLYTEFANLLVRMNNLVSDIEENPRKYFKFSVF